MGDQTFTALLHGEAGVGKSRLCDTTPAPRLILDAEGRARYLPSQRRRQLFWDPQHEAPPTPDGTWESCVAVVPDFATMERVYAWLQSGQHYFVSVCVDSLMEVQKRLIDDVAGLNQLKTQDWGTVLRKLEKLIRDYRDLVLAPSNTLRCVIFTTGTKVGDDKKARPLLQGALGNTVPYFVDVTGYLYVDIDPNTQAVSRNLLVAPSPLAVAKDGTDLLPGPVIVNADIGQIFAQLNGQPAPAVSEQQAVQSPTQPQEGGTAQ